MSKIKHVHGSGTQSRLSAFNKVKYSETQLKHKYREYIEHKVNKYTNRKDEEVIDRVYKNYGADKLHSMEDGKGQRIFIKIWQIRESSGISSLNISKKFSNVGEQTVRHILRFLEREPSIIKDILAGKKVVNDANPQIDSQTDTLKKQDAFDEEDRPSGSRTDLSNDQILFFIENCNNISMISMAEKFIKEEGSLENNYKNRQGINEKIKNLNDRLKGLTKDKERGQFIDSEKRIATNVNKAIRKGLIKWSNGRTFTTEYKYEEKKGWEKGQELARQEAQKWLPKAKELIKKEGLSQRKTSLRLKELGFSVGKTSIAKYQNLGLLPKQNIKS